MKFLFYIVIIAVAGWSGWQFYPDIYKGMESRIQERKKEKEKAIASAVDARKREDLQKSMPSSGGSPAIAMLENLKNRQAATPETNPNSGGPTNPGTVTPASKPAAPPKVVTVDEIEARYPMPPFKTIEEITKEWTTIPSKAFPRKVKTKVPLVFEGTTGKITLESGSDASAVAMRPGSGILIVMRPGDDTTRIDVPLANTDLKETLTALYERYKEYLRNRVVQQREHARSLMARSNGASEEQMKLAGPKPEVRPGGVIPIMISSIDELKLRELKANTITSWGNLNFEKVGDTVYWTGTVQCTVENALFGPTQTEVMALMKDNKVVKWLFTGSREEVQ